MAMEARRTGGAGGGMEAETFQLPAAATSLAAEAKEFIAPPHTTLPTVGPPSSAQLSALIEEMRHQDLSTRLNAFRNLPQIAQAMGPVKTRTQLIPYIAVLVENCDDDDEVLLLVASTLPSMIDEVGGAEFGFALLAPLEQLTGADDSAVRKKSVEAIARICAQLSDQHIVEHELPLVRRLASAEWLTSRISSAGLFPTLYPRTPDVYRKELRQLFLALCRTEETPTVKRAATESLGDFASVIEPKIVFEEFFPVLQKLAKDDQDSVRLLTVNPCVHIAKIFGRDAAHKALNVTKMSSIIKGLINDPAWRVRYVVADKFCELSSALGPSMAQSDSMLDDYVKLLSDPEAEVRTAAASRVGEVSKLAGEAQTIKKFLKPMGHGKMPSQSVLQQIVNDTDEATSFTRASLAGVLMSMCSVLKVKESTEYLLPLILTMLKDKNSDVRLNLLSTFETVPNLRECLPLEQINEQILECIKGKGKKPDPAAAAAAAGAGAAAAGTAATAAASASAKAAAPAEVDPALANNPKWRVRLQVIQLIPNLAKQLGEDFFDARLSEMCMEWLKDSVWSIREAATANLTKLAEGFGIEWAKRVIIPKVVLLGSDHSYLMRMTAVFAIQDMAPILGPQLTTERLLPVLVQLATDPVPNVRFNSAKVLGVLMTQGRLVLPQPLVEHTLAKLKGEDTDADVKYYADCSLGEINKSS